ncbi:MAG: CPBP family glutamic-type intramembrane protease [Nocardiopsaceae bacterium]|nr:CPBP family glutamic-type intramembrane protease [Nocardiopsaceae bacterium]
MGLAHPAGLISMLSTFVVGAGSAVLYLVGNRSLTPVIVAHMLVNLTIEPGLILSAF